MRLGGKCALLNQGKGTQKWAEEIWPKKIKKITPILYLRKTIDVKNMLAYFVIT